jgi:hypothetical protein
MFDELLAKLETDLRAAFDESLIGLVTTARTQLKGALAELATDRVKGLADVAREKADLHREIAAMHMHKEAQEGHVVLNIGGYRYETSVQTLRRLRGIFFDAYFSGRYAQDVCADGSIFIDRDGEHFGQVLQYLRDGVVSVAEQDALELDVGVLRCLKREFGFYSVELTAEEQELAFVVGGVNANGGTLASVERYDITSGAWQEAAPMANARYDLAICELGGELYAVGGADAEHNLLASVERYDVCRDVWCAAPPMPFGRSGHCAVAVGDAMYVMGGIQTAGTVPSEHKFDSRTQAWSEVAPLLEARASAGACVVGSDIYFLGGHRPDGSMSATTYCYSTVMDAWSTLAPMPEAKVFHSVCTVGGLIYVLGGTLAPSTSVHCFDPVANSWRAVAPMSIARSKCDSFVLDGSIYTAGGEDGLQRVASVERYDVTSNSSCTVASMGQVRSRSGAHAVHLEVDLFNSLILKAKGAQRWRLVCLPLHSLD